MLTAQREAFALALAEGATQAEAYRRAFPRSAKWKPGTVWSKASVLVRDDKVAARVAELQARAAEANAVTLEQHVATLANLRDEARASRQFGAAIQAEVARGKASGLYVERLQHTGRDGEPLSLAVVFAQPQQPEGGA